MNEKMKNFIKFSSGVAIVIFVVLWFVINNMLSLEFSLFSLMGKAIGITTIIMVFYEKILWRCIPFCKTPKLFKCYKGVITSTYDNKKRDAMVKIKQTFLGVNITLETEESESKSIFSSINEVSGKIQLTYTYLNTPNAAVRDRSAIHYGTVILNVENPENIKGQYFTDRKTTGDMNFHKV